VLTKVVVRAAPFQRTTDVATKPLPFTVSVVGALPAGALVGERLLTDGVGLGASGQSIRPVSNVAFTSVATLTVTAHAPVPEQPPVQPVKIEPESAAAVRVIAVPEVTACEQVAPQLIPAGAPMTVPEPVPSFVTDSIMRLAFVLNVAVTEVAALTVTTQLPVPEQAPLQPAKDEPAAGVAVSVTAVPGVKD
jgi:hypothetical protein